MYRDYKLPKVQVVIPKLDNLNKKFAKKSLIEPNSTKITDKTSKRRKKIQIIDLTQELRRSKRKQKIDGLQLDLDKSISNLGTQETNKSSCKKRHCK